MSDAVDNEPLARWKAWAKGEIQSANGDTKNGSLSNHGVIYLCRLLRILAPFHRDSVHEKSGVEREALHAAFMSGLAASGFDMGEDHSWLFDHAVSTARSRGFVGIDDVDEWQPGMVSGSGHRIICTPRPMIKRMTGAPSLPRDS
jgi:hypothetical protein